MNNGLSNRTATPTFVAGVTSWPCVLYSTRLNSKLGEEGAHFKVDSYGQIPLSHSPGFPIAS
jgi:hypothetical protein